MTWNTKFEDLFAVGYGSYEFPKRKEDKGDIDDKNDEMMDNGYIYVFSIKNNFFPEVKYTTDTGVLSLDFHPKDYSLLVAGMYDGTVCVYYISRKIKTAILTCDIRYQKHMEQYGKLNSIHHLMNLMNMSSIQSVQMVKKLVSRSAKIKQL